MPLPRTMPDSSKSAISVVVQSGDNVTKRYCKACLIVSALHPRSIAPDILPSVRIRSFFYRHLARTILLWRLQSWNTACFPAGNWIAKRIIYDLLPIFSSATDHARCSVVLLVGCRPPTRWTSTKINSDDDGDDACKKAERNHGKTDPRTTIN